MAFDNLNSQFSGEFNGLKSASQLRSEFKPISSQKITASNLEEAKGKLLAEIARQEYLAKDVTLLETAVAQLQQTKTVAEFEKAKNDLTNLVETNHQQVFSGALLQACQNASVKIGFTKIEAISSPILSVMRFSATDATGRTLITEINAPKNRDTKVETEVVGVSDGSCSAILDAFHQALEAEGVKSQPAKRKFTGGVCDLSAAKDFLAKKILPNQSVKNNGGLNDSADKKRSQRLNQTQQKQRQ